MLFLLLFFLSYLFDSKPVGIQLKILTLSEKSQPALYHDVL